MSRKLRDTVGPLVDGQALNIVTLLVPAGQSVAGILTYHAEVTDGTEVASEVGNVSFTAVNKAGTITARVQGIANNSRSSDGGALALDASTFTDTETSTALTLQNIPSITGTPTRSALRYEVKLLSPVATISNPA